jgi:hypothetical protein
MLLIHKISAFHSWEKKIKGTKKLQLVRKPDMDNAACMNASMHEPLTIFFCRYQYTGKGVVGSGDFRSTEIAWIVGILIKK